MKNTISKRAILFIKGFSMGVADIIPGVSGGTIALISGIYDELIGALGQLGLSHIRDTFYWINPLSGKAQRSKQKKTC